MRGFLHFTECKKMNVIKLTPIFKRPANGQVARRSFAAIRRPFLYISLKMVWREEKLIQIGCSGNDGVHKQLRN